MSSNDDRSTPARIRDAAIVHVGEHGWEKTTSRQIAVAAGVPVGLVNYHFGSKDGLREACDAWVLEVIGRDKSLLLGSGPIPQFNTYLDDHPELRPIMAYLAQSVRTGGHVAERFYDGMVEVTMDLLGKAADVGTLRRYEDLHAASSIFVAYGLGVSMFGPSVARHLGGTDLLDPSTYRRYVAAVMEIFSYPLITDARLVASIGEPPEADAEGEQLKENE